MANTIKLKTGSGSDPSASDLIVGEIAIRTDSGKLFTKKDNGSVAEISGGGGIDDGDKGDITVSNGGDTFTIDNGVVTSAKIADGTIVNADINASAAIDGSKIQTSGLFNSGVITSAQHNKLAGIEAGATADMTATEVLSLISGDNIILGEISSTGNSTFAGNITISSSDGGSAAAPELDLNRDSASPADSDYIGQIKFTGESDDGSKEVYAKITGKIGDASSGTEDRILEIAHRKAGSNNISARFTSTDLKLINGTGLEVAGNITVDGTVDGRDVASDGSKLDGIESGATADQSNSEIKTAYEANSNTNAFTDALLSKLNGIEASATAAQTASDIKTLFNSSGLVNAQIDASAAIAGTKISPDFGSQAVTTTGNGNFANVILSDPDPAIVFTDSNNNPDYQIIVDSGIFKVRDSTNAVDRFKVNSDGHVDVAGNLDVGAGVDVTGNITVTGTVDGVDIAARNTLFGGLTSSSGVLTNGVTATTQSAGDNSTKVATTAYTDTAISNLINGAPAALDTLNELAAAMNDDAAFSTTVTNSLATKMPLAGGQFTGNITFSGSQTVDGRDLSVDGAKLDGIESGATADQTASEILTLIKTVDGAGSGLNADLLDGISSASFVRSDADDTLNGQYTISDSANEKLVLAGSSNPFIRWQEGTTDKAFIQWSTSGYLKLKNEEDGSTLRIRDNIQFSTDDSTFYSIFHEGNLTVGDGGLTQNNFTDADHSKLNGIESGATADQTNSEIKTAYEANSNTNAFTDALLSKLNGIAASATNVTNNNQLTNGAGYITATLTNEQVQDIVGGMVSSNTESGITVTYQDGDGTLDFAVASQTDNNFTNADHSKLDGIESGATADQTASEIRALVESASDSNVFTDADHSKLNGIASGATNVTNTNQLTNGAGFITATLTNEQVQDIVGGMVTGNTESGITVTYQDSDGTLDFTVGTLNQNTTGNAATATKLATARTIAGVSFDGSANISLNNNAITNGAGYITSADGGNAATLDGIDSTSFVRSDANDTLSGNITLSSTSADCLNFSANSTNDNRGIAINDRTALSADYNDGYLRINNQSEFSNGVYTPTVMRADGGFSVGSVQVINTSGVVLAGRVQTLNQDTTGNAATATTLETARTIAGVSFDGSANISLNNNAITNGAGYLTAVNTGNITNNAVDFSKLQDIAQNRIIGRVASGSGDATTLTAANVRSMINVEDGANNITNNNQLTNGAGYITSASFSDIAGGGTFTGAITAPRISGSNGIVEMKQEIGTSQTLTTGYNAIAVDPTVASGVTITVPSGAVWAIV